MKVYVDREDILKRADEYAKCMVEIDKYFEEKNKKDREEFLSLLLDDEVIKNNRKLQEKYMELYDKYTSR